MATWGYRVYSVKLKYGHDALPLDDDGVRRKLYDLISDVQSQGTVKGNPKLRSIDESEPAEALDSEDESYAPSAPTLTIKNCEWRDPEHLHLLVAMGEAGLHEDLVDPNSQLRQSILHQSAEVTLRVDIYLPISGTKAILVTETQGMHDPVGRLFAWIQYQWILRKELLEKSNKEKIADWKQANNRGEAVGDRPKTESYKRYYMLRARLGDAALLKKIIDTAESGVAEFYELGPNGKKKHSLTRNVSTKKELGTLGKALQKFGAGNANLQKTKEETVLQLVEDLDYDAPSLQAAGVNLEGATLKLRSDAGNVTFKPGQASDVFTYPFKSGRPKDRGYYDATVTKSQALAPAASIELDDLEDWEVCEWLAKDPARSPLDQPSMQD